MTHHGDYGGLRHEVLAHGRRRAHELAIQGLSAAEIEARLNGVLTRTEQELLRVVIRSEVAGARRSRIAEALEPPGEDLFPARRSTADHEEVI